MNLMGCMFGWIVHLVRGIRGIVHLVRCMSRGIVHLMGYMSMGYCKFREAKSVTIHFSGLRLAAWMACFFIYPCGHCYVVASQ